MFKKIDFWIKFSLFQSINPTNDRIDIMKPKFEPTDDAEKRLIGLEDLDMGLQMDKTFSNPPDTCDYCETLFNGK